MAQLILLVGVWFFTFSYALFTGWTWQRLWRRGADAWERVVYDQGVRALGPRVGMILSISAVIITLRSGHAGTRWWQTITIMVAELAIVLPLCLWMGYALGCRIARTAGLTRSLEGRQNPAGITR